MTKNNEQHHYNIDKRNIRSLKQIEDAVEKELSKFKKEKKTELQLMREQWQRDKEWFKVAESKEGKVEDRSWTPTDSWFNKVEKAARIGFVFADEEYGDAKPKKEREEREQYGRKITSSAEIFFGARAIFGNDYIAQKIKQGIPLSVLAEITKRWNALPRRTWYVCGFKEHKKKKPDHVHIHKKGYKKTTGIFEKHKQYKVGKIHYAPKNTFLIAKDPKTGRIVSINDKNGVHYLKVTFEHGAPKVWLIDQKPIEKEYTLQKKKIYKRRRMPRHKLSSVDLRMPRNIYNALLKEGMSPTEIQQLYGKQRNRVKGNKIYLFWWSLYGGRYGDRVVLFTEEKGTFKDGKLIKRGKIHQQIVNPKRLGRPPKKK